MTGHVGAGPFGEWLAAMRAVLRGERDADVPCGSCVGCCVSSYPIPLRPGDELARAEVPERMLIGATPPGKDWLMGFRDDGSCPFLAARSCSIYAQRPQTCRDYDCRIYAAAGLLPDGRRPVIHERVQAWQFEFTSPQERQDAEAFRNAAQFIHANQQSFPREMRAGSATAAAVLAAKTFELFRLGGGSMVPPAAMVRRVIDAARAFDAE